MFPLAGPLISSKQCPFFILATWIIAITVRSPALFASKVVEYRGGLVCVKQWHEVIGQFLSFENVYMTIGIIFVYILLVPIVILYVIIF